MRIICGKFLGKYGHSACGAACSSRLQAMDEEMTNSYLKFFDMINKNYKIIITASRKIRILCGKFLWAMGRRYKGKGRWG